MSQKQGEYNVERIKAENSALRKYAAIQKAHEEKIGVQKIYIDITDNIEAALVLDEIIFFTLPREGGKSGLRVWKDGYLWMAVHRSDWWERKRIKERQVDTAIKKLETQNLIIKKVYKFGGQTTTHLRLNSIEFFKRYGEELEKSNPAEDESDSLSKDINDLYQMMGKDWELQNGDSQNGEGDLPNGETDSQNGDSINSPNQPPPTDFNNINERLAVLSKLYQNNIALITPLMADTLKDAATEFSDVTWYEAAFKIAVERNVHNWKFVYRVLKNWKDNGRDWTPEKLKKQPQHSTQLTGTNKMMAGLKAFVDKQNQKAEAK